MDFGLGLFPTQPPRELLKTVELADERGYTHLWMGDSQLIWRELYVNLGAAALSTKRITLAQGVTNPITRNVTVTASAVATLSELAGGRVAVGIGAGDSSVETYGARPASLARLEQYVVELRQLLAGNELTLGRGGVRLPWATASSVPIFVAASGPRILELAGKVADGVIMLAGTAPELVNAAMAKVRAGAQAAGRDLDAEGFRFVCWTPCAVSADGESARRAVKAHVARVLNRPLPFELGDDDQAIVRQIQQQYEYYGHMVVGARHGDLVPDRLVSKFALAGTPDEIRAQLARLRTTGVHQVAIVPHTSDPAERIDVVRQFADMAMGG